MDSISDTLTYPTNDDDWLRTVLIGGALLVFSFLIVPTFIVYGYVLRVIRGGLTDDRDPPQFGDWGDLLVDGLKAWVIGLVFMLVPLVVAAVTVGGSLLAMMTGTESGAAAGLAGLFGGIALSGLLALVFGYFAVIGIVAFADTGRIGDAFNVSRLVAIGTNTDYAVPWLVSVLVIFVAGAVTGVVSAIPFLGWIASAFVTFYALVVAGFIWGQGYADAAADDPAMTVEDTEDVAV